MFRLISATVRCLRGIFWYEGVARLGGVGSHPHPKGGEGASGRHQQGNRMPVPTSTSVSALRLLLRDRLLRGPSSGSLAWTSHSSAWTRRRWASESNPAAYDSRAGRTVALPSPKLRMVVPSSRRKVILSPLGRGGPSGTHASSACTIATARPEGPPSLISILKIACDDCSVMKVI